MITAADYFMGRDRQYVDEMTDEIRTAAAETIARTNMLLSLFHVDNPRSERVNSGWRPASVNAATPLASKTSNHLTGRAVDLDDDDAALAEWCMDHIDMLVHCGLWMEHPGWTPGWVHLQILPPRSHYSVRVFIPSASPPKRLAFGTTPVIRDATV